jgi:hypothetical protein
MMLTSSSSSSSNNSTSSNSSSSNIPLQLRCMYFELINTFHILLLYICKSHAMPCRVWPGLTMFIWDLLCPETGTVAEKANQEPQTLANEATVLSSKFDSCVTGWCPVHVKELLLQSNKCTFI